MQGAPSDVNGVQTSVQFQFGVTSLTLVQLLTLPEWTKTGTILPACADASHAHLADLLVPALHRSIDASFKAVSEPLAETIAKISA